MIAKVEEVVAKLRPMDDTFFHKLVEDTAFCEEVLRVILQKPDLRIVEAVPQRNLRNIKGRSVTVDVLCRDADGNYYNIEVQKQDNDDHQRRVRYNGSNIDTFISEKGTRFSELPSVYVIYISSFDYFGEHQTIYHVHRNLSETGTVVDNASHEIYVNTEVDDGSDIAGLMKIFKSFKIKDDPRFPVVCARIRHLKEGGGNNMCSVVEEYAQEVAKESRVLTYAEVGFSVEDIVDRTGFPREEIERILQEHEN